MSWNKRDLLLYAASIGIREPEFPFIYELDPNFAAYPTYPVILSLKGDTQEVTNFAEVSGAIGSASTPGLPKVDLKKLVHGDQKIEILKPLPVTSEGGEFVLQKKQVGVWDKGSGMLMEHELRLIDKKTNTTYAILGGSSFVIGAGGFGGPKQPKKPDNKPPAKQPDVVVQQTLADNVHLFYRLNSDYNPLHIDPTIGPKSGFKGAILQGLCSWAHAAHAITKTYAKSQPNALVMFEARFAKPVYPGDTLITEIWKTGEKDIGNGQKEITVLHQTKVGETVVLSQGAAILRVNAKGSKL